MEEVAPRRGFEPLTCPLGGGRAIQLCHRGEKRSGRFYWLYQRGAKASSAVRYLMSGSL